MPNSLFVRDCMHENPAKILADATIDEAMQLLLENKISGLTVVDEENTVVGVLSELDCLKATISNAYNEGSVGGSIVREFMTTTVDTSSPDDNILAVGQEMLAKQQRRRPVVKQGKLVGQVSCRNILWAVGNFTRESK